MTHTPPLHTFAKILLSAPTFIVIHGLLVRAYVCGVCVFSAVQMSTSKAVRALYVLQVAWAVLGRAGHLLIVVITHFSVRHRL